MTVISGTPSHKNVITKTHTYIHVANMVSGRNTAANKYKKAKFAPLQCVNIVYVRKVVADECDTTDRLPHCRHSN